MPQASSARPSGAPSTAYAEPRWRALLAPPPDLLIAVRPQAVRRDEVYGPVVRRAIDMARAQSRLVAQLGALDAMEDAEEVIVAARDRGSGRGDDPTDLVVVLRGVRADLDPASLVDEGGHALWAAGPAGPTPDVRELVRAATEGTGEAPRGDGDGAEASLFELPGRTWVIASSEARARARATLARSEVTGRERAGPDAATPLERFEREDRTLAMMRLSGPALVARVRALRPPALLSPIGRGLSDLTILLSSETQPALRATLTYVDESAVPLAESTARSALDATRALRAQREASPAAPDESHDGPHRGTNPDDYAWLREATVRASRCCVAIDIPLPPVAPPAPSERREGQ